MVPSASSLPLLAPPVLLLRSSRRPTRWPRARSSRCSCSCWSATTAAAVTCFVVMARPDRTTALRLRGPAGPEDPLSYTSSTSARLVLFLLLLLVVFMVVCCAHVHVHTDTFCFCMCVMR